MRKSLVVAATLTTLALAVTPLAGSAVAGGDSHDRHGPGHHHGHHHKAGPLPGGYKHLVVIYEENHSFDNLYGDWDSVEGQHVDGLSDATPERSTQVDKDGAPYACLLQNDVNLTSPDPLPTTCTDDAHGGYQSHFTNKPFAIDDYIRPGDRTCPKPGVSAPNGLRPDPANDPGGCTRDLVHRFYQEQYQIDGGKQDRYETGSDAVGLTMGHYDTKNLPIYEYLHSKGAPHYVIADHFFQAAFGGSFLNHQWLIAAQSPLDTDPSATWTTGKALNSAPDAAGMPTSYPQYTAGPNVVDGGKVVDDRLTQKCADGGSHYEAACGNWAVNTIQPGSTPHGNGPYLPLIDDTKYPNIGDELSAKGISWAWYTGQWDAKNANDSNAPLFQYHHQPFNYFANYAPGQPGRAHLQDEDNFIRAAQNGTLPTVSFVKPYGSENEHPGYASEANGSDHLVDLLKAVTEGGQAGNTLVVVTYDEFGGQWDHVSPPSAATGAKPGTYDKWGPGTRIPALVLARNLKRSGVDHTPYDTTSILATIEDSFGLAPMGTRDAAVNPLDNAVAAGGR